MEGIIQQVTLDRASRKKDKSVSMTFITELELDTAEFMKVDENLNARGILYFSPKSELTQEEKRLIDEVDIVLEGKSKSQRLRSVIFILWKQLGENGTFDSFYSNYMEKIIEGIKSKLD